MLDGWLPWDFIAMPAEQPRYLTLIDLFWEVVNVVIIATGCYIGWLVANNYLALLLGGLLGRIVGVAGFIGFRRLAGIQD
jgi:hypothetical protein